MRRCATRPAARCTSRGATRSTRPRRWSGWAPTLVDAFERFVDDLSNWYIRRSRRRFWDGDAAALQTLWHALVTALRVVGPVMPFLADHLWRVLRADDAPASVFLAGWPEVGTEPGDEELLAEVAAATRAYG